MSSDPRQLVESGYNAMAEEFAAWINEIDGDPRERFLDELEARLDPGSRILELGCGAGGSGVRRLAERHDVLGVDLSEEQVRLASQQVPGARFEQGDMREVAFPPASFDAVISCYAILHLPREDYAGLFGRIASWLRPGGRLLVSLGAHDDAGTVEEWIGGAEMFFTGFPPDTNRELLRAAGFELELDEPITMYEPEGAATFHWLLGHAAGATEAASGQS